VHFVKADKIFNGKEYLPEDSVLVLNQQHDFVEIIQKNTIDSGKIQSYEGIICPGFVNAHCHTELSHLKNKISEKTGLIEFGKQVIIKRNNCSKEEIAEHILEADKEMWRNGIVAVGDICNTAESFKMKEKSSVFYHSFIELLGFNPSKANESFYAGINLLEKLLSTGLSGSLAPHAPYSTSKELIKKISDFNFQNAKPSSIHNQESDEERKFFMGEKSAYHDLFEFLKIDTAWFNAPKINSLQYYQDALGKQQTLMVHNTFSTKKDIDLVSDKNIFWCFCSNANLYIENKLPDYTLFGELKNKISLGTDSLASNHSLSLISEANILLANSNFKFEEILTALTFNGALSLNLQYNFGTFIPNKNSGLNLIAYTKNQIHLIKKLA